MFLDTSGLFCVHHEAEILHSQASKAFQGATRRLTHSYVLAEFVALAHARKIPRLAALSFVADLAGDSDVEVVWVDELLHREGMALLQARLDKTYSLCDAVSFVLMRRYAIQDALTTDRHFEQEGFQRLLM